MKRIDLAKAIWEFGTEYGFDEMAAVCARTLIGLAHASGGNDLEFTCDQGIVNVKPDLISEHRKN